MYRSKDGRGHDFTIVDNNASNLIEKIKAGKTKLQDVKRKT